MSEWRLPALLGLAVSFASPPARAELPSLMTDTGVEEAKRAERHDPSEQAIDSGLLRRGRIYLQALGSVDYRFAGQGLKARFAYRGGSVSTLLGYSGEHRFELDWRSQGRDFKLAFTVGDSNGGYRVEFVRDF